MLFNYKDMTYDINMQTCKKANWRDQKLCLIFY